MSETRRPSRVSVLLAVLITLPLLGTTCRPAPYAGVHEIASGLSRPIVVVSPPGDPRLFVVERAGRVREIDPVTRTVGATYLDISGRVASTGGDRGLHSIAFAPDYATSGELYATYQNSNNHMVLARFVASRPESGPADPQSQFELARFITEGLNSHGGGLQFGPDGMLYVGVGDGRTLFGSPGNPQATSSLVGKILRLEVRGGPRARYAVPADNPFVGVTGYAPEIWALGVHDPLRLDFDPDTGDLWFADRGRTTADEVNRVPAGGGVNLGWPMHEGNACVRPFAGAPCEDPSAPVNYTFPVHAYANAAACRIAGGLVYAGGNDQLRGTFSYADSCTRHLFVVLPEPFMDMTVVDVTQPLLMNQMPPFVDVASIGSDGYGEPHLVGRDSGTVFRIQIGYDVDDDGITEPTDNCPFDVNRDQADGDEDGVGDACDPD